MEKKQALGTRRLWWHTKLCGNARGGSLSVREAWCAGCSHLPRDRRYRLSRENTRLLIKNFNAFIRPLPSCLTPHHMIHSEQERPRLWSLCWCWWAHSAWGRNKKHFGSILQSSKCRWSEILCFCASHGLKSTLCTEGRWLLAVNHLFFWSFKCTGYMQETSQRLSAYFAENTIRKEGVLSTDAPPFPGTQALTVNICIDEVSKQGVIPVARIILEHMAWLLGKGCVNWEYYFPFLFSFALMF